MWNWEQWNQGRGKANPSMYLWAPGLDSVKNPEELWDFIQIVSWVTEMGSIYPLAPMPWSGMPRGVGVNILTLPGVQWNASEPEKNGWNVSPQMSFSRQQRSPEQPRAESERSVVQFRGGAVMFLSPAQLWVQQQQLEWTRSWGGQRQDPRKTCLTQLERHCHSYSNSF